MMPRMQFVQLQNHQNWQQLLDHLVALRTLVDAAKRWYDLLVENLNSTSMVKVGGLNTLLDEAGYQEYQRIRQSLISQPAPAEPIISDTGTSVIQNDPEPEPAYRATFSSEGSMAYLAGGGTLETIIVPD